MTSHEPDASVPRLDHLVDRRLVRRPSFWTSTEIAQRFARRTLVTKLRGLERCALHVFDLHDGSVLSAGSDRGVVEGEIEATVRIRDPRFYPKAVFGGSIGVAEAYMEGWWESDDLSETLRLFARNRDALDGLDAGWGKTLALLHSFVQMRRANTRRGSRRNIGAHYDLSNEFFEVFLDRRMMYSAAIYEREDMSLDEASVVKMDRLATKLDLRPTDHLLEIGTGWGGFALHAAADYGCRVTTTTISRRQYEYSRRAVEQAGLSHRIDVRLQDYRDLEGTFDKLVSIEMIEAVGHRFLGTYFETCSRLLEPGGLMALQGIVMADRHFETYRRSVDFIQRYVFPGSALPSVGRIATAAAKADLQILHLEDIGPHYARTLSDWRERFFQRIDEIYALGFSERFVRLWEFYLGYCEAGFLERSIGDVQVLLARADNRRAPVLGRI
ncbi:MAG: cyclopropane-fatty-acyl-phospholipid synthase family protein [Thermoanaerobaculia bacterium]|nr:cyclopropane-fatty-acyl-phospholipid synthase family protein [Thermoanaerobaculia bacterium]